MLVEYKNTNVSVIYFSSGNGIMSKNVKLLGGVNKVERSLEKRFSEHPQVIKMFSDGVLNTIDSGKKDSTPEPSATPDLARLNSKDAISIVAKTLNKDLLEEWLATEGRIGVQNSVVKQLKKLELTEDEKKELGI